jgi:hypothetical protein
LIGFWQQQHSHRRQQKSHQKALMLVMEPVRFEPTSKSEHRMQHCWSDWMQQPVW